MSYISARKNSIRRLAEMSAEYYFSGDCNDLVVQTEIKDNFLQIIQSSLWKSKCNEKCDIQNVQVPRINNFSVKSQLLE